MSVCKIVASTQWDGAVTKRHCPKKPLQRSSLCPRGYEMPRGRPFVSEKTLPGVTSGNGGKAVFQGESPFDLYWQVVLQV